MRVVFIGASSLAVKTAQLLIRRGHEVVIVERDKEVIDDLSGQLDCAFVHGDGSKPAILREVGPSQTDTLYCLTGHDQSNIIASLVGRSLGFERVVTKIEDEAYEHICIELGLEDTIIPARTIGRYLADMAEGQDILELSAMIRYDARVVSVVVHEKDAVTVAELDLPADARAVCLYREEKLILPDGNTKLAKDDELFLLTRRTEVNNLIERFRIPPSENDEGGSPPAGA